MKTIIEAWKAWRARTGLPDEDSQKDETKPQPLAVLQYLFTLKHCFEQIFHPLDDAGDRLQQLRCLWRCCYALLKSDFFGDVFNEWGSYHDSCEQR